MRSDQYACLERAIKLVSRARAQLGNPNKHAEEDTNNTNNLEDGSLVSSEEKI